MPALQTFCNRMSGTHRHPCPVVLPAFVFFTASTAPGHALTIHPAAAPSVSRRRFIHAALASAVCMPTVATANEVVCPPPQQVAQLLLNHCQPFISLVKPITVRSLLWRGTQSNNSLSKQSPRPDLLDERTYGPAGAVFFAQLEQQLYDTDAVYVAPSRAHIAVGDRSVAAQWGSPVTIWPVGHFQYSYWSQTSLIYVDGESVEDAKRRGGQLVTDFKLREAVCAGKEVMFDSVAFYEIEPSLAQKALQYIT